VQENFNSAGILGRNLGFDHLKEMYQSDLYFREAYEACVNLVLRYKSQWAEYLI